MKIDLSNGRSILLRLPVADDQAYVAKTWASSLLSVGMPRNEAVAEVNRTVDELLDDKATALRIACEPLEPARIVGWIAWAKIPACSVLLYVNVRKADREQGIGRELAKAAGLDNAARIGFLFDGPAASWLVGKATRATKIEPRSYLA